MHIYIYIDYNSSTHRYDILQFYLRFMTMLIWGGVVHGSQGSASGGSELWGSGAWFLGFWGLGFA